MQSGMYSVYTNRVSLLHLKYSKSYVAQLMFITDSNVHNNTYIYSHCQDVINQFHAASNFVSLTIFKAFEQLHMKCWAVY